MQNKSIPIYILTIAVIFLGIGATSARNIHPASDDLTIGAQLYDKWYALLKTTPPSGNMPIWERQTTNTRSGPDTWRCSECHGWDYKGSEGAYGSGSHYTGFPNVMKLAADLPAEEIVAHLKGSKDPSHNFSKYLDDASLNKLAQFLKEGVIDDSAFIDSTTLKTKGGDIVHGKQLFENTCVQCHGADGKKIVFRTEGVNEYLGSVAKRDPYRFLHRTRFGVAGTEMPVGRDLGWKPADGVDVLAYAQSLPTGTENEPNANAGAGSEPAPKLGGPQGGVVGGILTGLAAVFGMVGGSLIFLLGLLVLGMLIVWALRKR
jgi:mono/diheme cytochrome c family protein